MRALIAAAIVAATTPAMADTFSTYQLGGNTYGSGNIGGRPVYSDSYRLGNNTYTRIQTGGLGGRTYSCDSYRLGSSTYTNCR
jgi:hypothetical protein